MLRRLPKNPHFFESYVRKRPPIIRGDTLSQNPITLRFFPAFSRGGNRLKTRAACRERQPYATWQNFVIGAAASFRKYGAPQSSRPSAGTALPPPDLPMRHSSKYS